jgi:hypothetical protein
MIEEVKSTDKRERITKGNNHDQRVTTLDMLLPDILEDPHCGMHARPDASIA